MPRCTSTAEPAERFALVGCGDAITVSVPCRTVGARQGAAGQLAPVYELGRLDSELCIATATRHLRIERRTLLTGQQTADRCTVHAFQVGLGFVRVLAVLRRRPVVRQLLCHLGDRDVAVAVLGCDLSYLSDHDTMVCRSATHRLTTATRSGRSCAWWILARRLAGSGVELGLEGLHQSHGGSRVWFAATGSDVGKSTPPKPENGTVEVSTSEEVFIAQRHKVEHEVRGIVFEREVANSLMIISS